MRFPAALSHAVSAALTRRPRRREALRPGWAITRWAVLRASSQTDSPFEGQETLVVACELLHEPLGIRRRNAVRVRALPDGERVGRALLRQWAEEEAVAFGQAERAAEQRMAWIRRELER